MPRIALTVLLAGTVAPAVPPVFALEWQQQSLELRAAPLQAELPVEFPFVNRSDRPVAIRQVQPNCDCLEAAADKPSYAPGEHGVIRALFSVGDRIGTYDRAIMVQTDETDQPVRLTVRIEVPAAAEVSPRMVEWARNSEPAAKSVEIAIADGLSAELTGATPTSDRFQATLAVIEPGRRYRLTIRPAGTAAPANAAVRVRGRSVSGQDIMVSAYANVR